MGTRGALDILRAGTNRQSLQGVITGCIRSNCFSIFVSLWSRSESPGEGIWLAYGSYALFQPRSTRHCKGPFPTTARPEEGPFPKATWGAEEGIVHGGPGSISVGMKQHELCEIWNPRSESWFWLEEGEGCLEYKKINVQLQTHCPAALCTGIYFPSGCQATPLQGASSFDHPLCSSWK